MKEAFGTRHMDKPEGMLKAIHFPSMATMNQRTGDGRKLLGEGRGVRDLPRTLYAQPAQAMGHDGAVPVGRIDQVIFDGDNIEGFGWLQDSDEGRKALRDIVTQVQFHNSVDLAEVKIKLDIEEDEDGMLSLIIDFTKWKIAASTIVGKPAFANARGEVLDDETTAAFEAEITAALEDPTTPLDWGIDGFEIRFHEPELTAALAVHEDTVVPWDDFHIPEADRPTKHVVDDEGRVYGHLALWDVGDDVNTWVKVPRPRDNYASFNQAGPWTELGQVETGPIFFRGGHPDKPIGNGDANKAYGDVDNCWADVRVVPGKFGPWMSGRVVKDIDAATLARARASRVSGHWVGDKLRAIVSVNVPRFNVAGSGKLADDSFYEATFNDEGELVELVASFPDHMAADSEATFDEDQEEDGELEEFLASQSEPESMFAVDTTPTIEMAAEAEQGLAWRKEFGRGGGAVARARARDIKNRKKLAVSTLRRMQSFFQRSQHDDTSPGWSKDSEGFPSAARINWALWGGDAAKGWVAGKLAALDQEHADAAAAEVDADLLLLELDLADD